MVKPSRMGTALSLNAEAVAHGDCCVAEEMSSFVALCAGDVLRKKTTPLTPFFKFTGAVAPAPCAPEEHQAVEEPQVPLEASSASSSMPASSSSSLMPASSSSLSMPATKGKGKGRQGNKGMPVRTVYKLKFNWFRLGKRPLQRKGH